MSSPGAEAVPDYDALVASALLTAYFNALMGMDINSQLRSRHALELQLQAIALRSPRNASRLLRTIDGAFQAREDFQEMLGAIDWYMDFLTGCERGWLNEVHTLQLVRIWKAISESPLRAKVLRTLLLVDLEKDPQYPGRSAVVSLFRDYRDDSLGEQLSPEQLMVARCLLYEAAAAPDVLTAEVANMRYFSLRVLRACLQADPREAPPRDQLDQVLALIGELGDPIQREFEATLGTR